MEPPSLITCQEEEKERERGNLVVSGFLTSGSPYFYYGLLSFTMSLGIPFCERVMFIFNMAR